MVTQFDSTTVYWASRELYGIDRNPVKLTDHLKKDDERGGITVD
jgi:hypothetical protein